MSLLSNYLRATQLSPPRRRLRFRRFRLRLLRAGGGREPRLLAFERTGDCEVRRLRERERVLDLDLEERLYEDERDWLLERLRESDDRAGDGE